MAIKVIAIDDHPLILKHIAEDLDSQPDIEVVGTANHGNQLMQLVRTTQPDVVVLDLGMTGEAFEPVSAVRQLKQEHPKVQVLVLTGYDDELYMREIIRTGAMGYLLKSDDLTLNLPQAVRKVYRGERFYSDSVIDKLLFGIERQHNLNAQELSVLRLVAQGLVNERIGKTMGVSERRIRNILTNIYAKMGIQEEEGINPRVSVVLKGRQMGLFPKG